MVELVINRLEDRFDLRKVANPSGVRIDLSFDINGNAERVTMQTATFVALGNVGEAVCGFEDEFFEQFQGV